jgi:nicotinamidase-related amidase
VSARAATFEGVLAPEPGRTALLVVDMQRGFVEAGEAMGVPSSISAGTTASPAVRSTVRCARMALPRSS